MDMRPNIPASQSPSAPPTERDDQRMSMLENTVDLLLSIVRQQKDEIKELHSTVENLSDGHKKLQKQVEELKGSPVAQSPIDGDSLEFNFDGDHLKKDIYSVFIELYDKGYIKSNISKIIRFLATATNLGTESSIRSQFYTYK